MSNRAFNKEDLFKLIDKVRCGNNDKIKISGCKHVIESLNGKSPIEWIDEIEISPRRGVWCGYPIESLELGDVVSGENVYISPI